jgi:hypothetical protein
MPNSLYEVCVEGLDKIIKFFPKRKIIKRALLHKAVLQTNLPPQFIIIPSGSV